MTFTRQQLIFIGVAAVIILFFLLLLLGVLPGRRGGGEPPATLNVWGIDSEETWQAGAASYRKLHSNITVEYTSFNPETYEKELINSLAAGRGPDIFMFNSRWLLKHGDKIVPAPKDKLKPATFSILFPQVAEQDFITGGNIYALPLSIDTLVLLYNRDVFDARGVALPPKTWDNFLAIVPKLRILKKSELTLAPAAIGGTLESMPNAPDILNLLMMQFGATNTDEGTGRRSLNLSSNAAGNALDFYTKFANPKSSSYAWSDSLGDSTTAFANGRVAMFFAYAYEIPEIREKNPFLNFAGEAVPQLDQEKAVNIANYWGLAVSNRSRNQAAAWDFVIYAATNRDTALSYLQSTGRPPALRSLISYYLNDPGYSVYARQALTARSWRQSDDQAIKTIFNNMISAVLEGGEIYQVLRQAEAELIRLETRK